MKTLFAWILRTIVYSGRLYTLDPEENCLACLELLDVFMVQPQNIKGIYLGAGKYRIAR